MPKEQSETEFIDEVEQLRVSMHLPTFRQEVA